MKKVSMSGSARTSVGKKDAKNLRKQGNVPCVLYGGTEQVHFALDAKALKKIIQTPEVYLVEISVDEKQYLATLQDVQFHPVSDEILHVDFLQVIEGKNVKVSLPVKLHGVPIGVLRGGKLTLRKRKLLVSGPADKLPENIDIDVTKLNIGGAVRVENIKLEGVTFLDKLAETVAIVKTARGVATADLADEEDVAEAATDAAASTENA